MQLAKLQEIIRAAGGGENALAYAAELLPKVNRLETSGYAELIRQFSSARDPANFRGYALEINFANLFLAKNVELTYANKQGGTGDIDFSGKVDGRDLFLELKLLGEDQATKEALRRQLDASGTWARLVSDDTRDVGRMQMDIIAKSSTRKFNSTLSPGVINCVVIDVTELQLGAVDVCYCLLAVGGNTLAARYCEAAHLRPRVVGVFERLAHEDLTNEQAAWVAELHRPLIADAHPRDYIHGVLFLFRNPAERAAISYALSGILVWNVAIVSDDDIRSVGRMLREVIPIKTAPSV